MRIFNWQVAAFAAIVTTLGVGVSAQADVFNQGPTAFGVPRYSLQFTNVGNPGNPDHVDPTTGLAVGGVDYAFDIAKTELPSGVWIEYANSVGLHLSAGGGGNPIYHGGGMNHSSNESSRIERFTDGPLTKYRWVPGALDEDTEGRPVGGMNFLDTARFVNWLHHGQPQATTAAESLANYNQASTGAYDLTAAGAARAVVQPGAKFWIATEDEWYKAAYYDPTLNGGTGGYWQYPTQSNTPPDNGSWRGLASNVVDQNPAWHSSPSTIPDGGNRANFKSNNQPGDAQTITTRPFQINDGDHNGNFASEVGWFEDSASYYGTFDQGGNLWEAMPTSKDASSDAVRRGGWYANGGGNDMGIRGTRLSGTQTVVVGTGDIRGGRDQFQAGDFDGELWHDELQFGTWRIARVAVPEPASLSMLVMGGALGLLLARRRRTA
ncbi:MAG: PEP-CTERM sorting domain-containing protein [Planctomycetota bacterium]|nr:PEP-CTERM sorting domain-containing protein [Planctomycetota bacterium]